MKKTIIFLIGLFMTVNSFAEFKVMGVNVDCSIAEAILRFQQHGFEKISENVLKGNYLGHRVGINLVADKKTNIVGWVIAFVFYTQNEELYPSWTVMKKDIIDLSLKLQERYNVKYISSFNFKPPYIEGDGNEFKAICTDKADISTTLFPDKDGIFTIKLYPSSFDVNNMYIILHFYNQRFGMDDLNK